MNLSFAGCGFLGIYHIGVACCFRKYCPHLLLNEISGASIGAIAACCLICDLPLGEMTSDMLRIAARARKRSLGPFHPSFNIQEILLEGLEKILPKDAHLKVNGKLHVSLTRVHDGQNVIVSHFDSREDLLQALLASAFIPFFSGLIPPKFHGVRYIDGGFSDNLPSIDENTITVSPFCGESDICPRDDSSQLFHINVANTSIEVSKYNFYRIGRILYPPRPEVLSNMCRQGFDDALRFLHMNNLISCTRCLSVQSTFVVTENVDENMEYDPECTECNKHREEALVSSHMPDTVVTIFQEAIDKANKGLINWMFKHRGMKLLSILTLPYTLPVDIMYCTLVKMCKLTNYNIRSAVGSKVETRVHAYRVLGNAIQTNKHFHYIPNKRLVSTAPHITSSVWDLSKYFLEQVADVITKVNKKRKQLSSKITCQFKITEYTGEEDNVDSAKNKVNLNFTLNLEDSDLPDDQSPPTKLSTRMLSKKPSLASTIGDVSEQDHDTFDHILQVTAQHEAIMAYYYMDENNKVKVTEIFDVTDCDSEVVQTNQERDVNTQLEFDDDWGQTGWAKDEMGQLEFQYESGSCEELSQSSQDDILDKDSTNIFSDPESEWNTPAYKVDEPEDEMTLLKPECEQASNRYKDYKIPAYTYEKLDS